MNPFSDPSYLLPPLVAAATCFILMAVVWRGTYRGFADWVFCGVLLSVAVWSMLVFGMRSSPDIYHALAWDRVTPVFFHSTFVLYYHFTLTYTKNKGQRGFLVVAYLSLVAFAALTPTDQLIEGMRLENYGYAPTPGPLGPALAIGVLLLVVGAAYNLLRRYKLSLSHEERNRLLYLVIALLLPLFGGFLDAFSNLPPMVIWSNLTFCVVCSIAILKYHLLDIHLVIRKGTIYLLISFVVAIPYVGLLYLLHYIFEPALEPWWVHVLIILVLAVILRPLYSRLQQFVDRLFYRDRYDFLRALEQFGQDTQSIRNLEELGSKIVRLISGALRISSACLLLPAEGRDGLVVVSSTGLDSPPSGVVLKYSSPLVQWLELHGGIISSEQLNIVPQLQSLPLKQKSNLERMGAKIHVPI